MHRKIIYFAQAPFIDAIVIKRSSAYLTNTTEVSVENKGREKHLEKERTGKNLLVTGFTLFKAVLLFCKQHNKYFNTVMQHYIVSIMNLSTWFISTHAKVWDHRSCSSGKRVWNVNTCINVVLFIIFTSTGLQVLHNRLEHVHDPEHIHVVKRLRWHWIADFKGFKCFLPLPLIGLKLRIHIQLSTLSGSVQKVKYKNWVLYSEMKMYPQETQ